MEDFEEIPPEERVALAKKLAAASPPQQIDDVVTELKKIAGDDFTEEEVDSAYYEYVLKSPVLLTLGDRQMVVHKLGEVSKSHFVDTHNKSLVHVDVKNQSARVIEEEEEKAAPAFPEGLEEQRKEVLKGVGKYADEVSTKDNKVGYEVYAAENTITAVLVTTADKLSDFWAGKQVLELQVSIDGSDATLSGTVSTHTHYFEGGNVQFKQAKTFEEKKCNVEDLDSEVAKYLKAQGGQLVQGTNEIYMSMENSTLKAFRRALPISGQKMVWNVHAHKMIGSLKQTP